MDETVRGRRDARDRTKKSKKDKSFKKLRDKSLPAREKVTRSPSRTRFYSWRMRCLQKSWSLDQTQLKDDLDDSTLATKHALRTKEPKPLDDGGVYKGDEEEKVGLQLPDVTQADVNILPNRSPARNIEVDLLKSLRRSRSPTPTSTTPPRTTLLLPNKNKPSAKDEVSSSSEDNVSYVAQHSAAKPTPANQSSEPSKSVAVQKTEQVEMKEGGDQQQDISTRSPSWLSSTGGFVWQVVQDVVKDFTFDDPEQIDETGTEDDGDNLSVKKMKENIIRFSALFRSFMIFWCKLHALFKWTKPKSTALVLGVSSYVIAYDWWMCSLLAYLTSSLALNYIRKLDRRAIEEKARLYLHSKYLALLNRMKSVKNKIWPFSKHQEETSPQLVSQLIPVTRSSSSDLEELTRSGSKSQLSLEKSSSKSHLGLEKNDKPQKKLSKFEENFSRGEKSDKTEVKAEKIPTSKDKDDKMSDKSDGLGEKIVFVLQVARRTQNWLGAVMDYADRVQAILRWEDDLSGSLFSCLCFVLLLSLLLSPGLIIKLAVTGLMFKISCFDWLQLRCNKMKKIIWLRWDLWKNALKAEEHQTNLESSQAGWEFLETFDLPPSELPLKGWETGKRCTLVNRYRSLASAFKNGRLYLTPSFVCFERNKFMKEKNVKIALGDVESILKAESYSWIPGGGMAIEICMKKVQIQPEALASSKTRFFLDPSEVEPLSTLNTTTRKCSSKENVALTEDESDKLLNFENSTIDDLNTFTNASSICEMEEQQSRHERQREYQQTNEGTIDKGCPEGTKRDATDVDGASLTNDRVTLNKKTKTKRNKNRSHSYFFGGIRNRDEAYESLVQAVRVLQSTSAGEAAGASAETPPARNASCNSPLQ